MKSFQEDGHTVVREEKAVLIMTALMIRAHNLPSAKEVVFVDSTGSCDFENHCITFMLTDSPAGAVPLGAIITKGQSQDEFKAG